MPRFLSSRLAAALLAAAGACSLRASEVIYHNGQPDRFNGSEMTEYVEADDVELTGPTRLDRVKFWDFEVPGSFAGSFTWEIHANDDDNSPGRLLLSGTSTNLSHAATGATVGGLPEYLNTFDLGPIVLRPGTYWLAVHNGPRTNNVPPLSFYWEATPGQAERASHASASPLYAFWFSNSFPPFPSDLAFFVEGVPLPRITALALNGPTPRISFTTAAGEKYRVEYSNSLVAPAWTTLPGAEMVAGTGGVVQVTDPQPNVRSLPRRFYRVLLL